MTSSADTRPSPVRHDLKSRPACHRKREYTDAHLSIVFAALAVTCFIEDRTDRSIEALRPHRVAERTAPPSVDLPALKQRLGRTGAWLSSLAAVSADQERRALAAIEELGYGTLWFGETPQERRRSPTRLSCCPPAGA